MVHGPSCTHHSHIYGQDKYLRSVADFRNLQDRIARDTQAAQAFAIQRFVKDLIDSVDNLDRALNTIPAEKLIAPSDDADQTSLKRDLINLHDGLKMTETILMQTLKKHGVERFDPAESGEAGATPAKFDPNLHEAIFQAPVPGKEDGTVFHTQQKGFTLNGRVLRVCSPIFFNLNFNFFHPPRYFSFKGFSFDTDYFLDIGGQGRNC